MQTDMELDQDVCYRAVKSRDRRFDGVFYTAVAPTGIYCRPSCPATTPGASATSPSTARPRRPGGRLPGLPALPARRHPGLPGLGRRRRRGRPRDAADRRRASSSARASTGSRRGSATRPGTCNRVLTAELGAGPLALARARRAQTARILIETTDDGASPTSPSRPASPASASSTTPSARSTPRTPTRAARRSPEQPAGRPGSVELRLAGPRAVRRPRAAALPGRRTGAGGRGSGPDWYERTLCAAARSRPGPARPAPPTSRRRDGLRAGPRGRTTSATSAPRWSAAGGCSTPTATRSPSTTRCRRPAMAALVRARPGLRVPGQRRRRRGRDPGGDRPADLARRGGIARRQAGQRDARRAPADAGRRRADPAVPDAATRSPRSTPSDLPMPRARARALVGLCCGAGRGRRPARPQRRPRPSTRARCSALPGIGPWTADYVALRALGDPDVFLPTDIGVRRRAARLGHATRRRAAEALSRALAALALLRADAPVGDPRPDADFRAISSSTTERRRLTCGPRRLARRTDPRGRADGALTSVDFDRRARPAMPRRAPRSRVAADRSAAQPVGERADDDPLLAEAARQLARLLRGRAEGVRPAAAPEGTRLPAAGLGAAPAIGYGETASYGEIAAPARHDRRRVPGGRLANGRNPIAIVIPCHRVVGANGTLTGYAGGLERKSSARPGAGRALLSGAPSARLRFP